MAARHVTICYHRQDTKKVSSVGQTDCSNFGTFASFKVGAGKLQMFLFIQCRGCVERLLMGFSTKVSSLSHNCRNKTAVDHEWGVVTVYCSIGDQGKCPQGAGTKLLFTHIFHILDNFSSASLILLFTAFVSIKKNVYCTSKIQTHHTHTHTHRERGRKTAVSNRFCTHMWAC